MTTKAEKLYPDINFNVSQSNHCCGIAEVGGFEEDTDGYDWWARREITAPKKYATREEQADACYKDILRRTDKKGDHEQAFAQLICSLVTKYKGKRKPQFPELAKLLKEKGWEEYSTFRNPNHGNTITLYGLRIPQRERMRNPYGYE